MWTWIRHLAVQQTTAPELATFLVVVTVLCVVVACTIYGAIITAAWALKLRPKHSWLSVVFPSTQRLKEHASEYLFAGLTSLVLTLTLAEKDRLVDTVLSLDASTFIDSSVVANVFPLGRLPSGADVKLQGSSFRNEVVKLPSTKLSGLVQGPLAAGRAEGVRAVFVDAAKMVLARPGLAARIAAFLKVLALAMMAVYVVWLSVRRIQALSSESGDGADLQNAVARQLVVLGVCLALLLANPLGSPSADLLADSAVAAARIAPPQAPFVHTLATLGIQAQNQVLAAGKMGQDDIARRGLAELSDSLRAANQRLLGLETSLAKAMSDMAAADYAADIRRLNAGLDSLRRRASAGDGDAAALRRLAVTVDSLKNRALLFVFAGAPTAAVRVQGVRTRFVHTDTMFGVYLLPPGDYSVSGLRGPISLAPGESRTVIVRQR
jgi:hypothetical protein